VRTLGLIVEVMKLRIGVLIMLCALAGMAVTPGEMPHWWRTVLLAVAVIVASGAAGAFNHYVERDIDARMRRTAKRPFVTGRLKPGPLWLPAMSIVLAVAVAAATFATSGLAAFYVLMGALVYGVVYTLWLKRRSALNIVVGGLAGSVAVLAGAAAVSPDMGIAPVALAVVLFLWTPPHFWSLAFARRDDYAHAGIPMMPCVVQPRAAAWIILAHTAALVAVSLVPAFYGLGTIYALTAIVAGGVFLRTSMALVVSPTPLVAMRNFKSSLVHLGALLTSIPIDRLLGF